MRIIVVLIFVLSCGVTYSQFTKEAPIEENDQFNESKMMEDAQFKSTKEGMEAFSTDLELVDVKITDQTLNNIKKDIYRKEGIFLVQLLDEGKTIRVLHFGFIEIEVIKEFILPYVQDFHPHERVAYTFN